MSTIHPPSPPPPTPTIPSPNHPPPHLHLPTPELLRRREWNRGPLTDLFPRIPPAALAALLDKALAQNLLYQLARPRTWNARRLALLAIAHVRHTCTEYDRLLRRRPGEGEEEEGGGGGLERWEARRRTGDAVWRVLRAWCPWDEEGWGVVEGCWRVTLLRPEERAPEWDPMEIDAESDEEEGGGEGGGGWVERLEEEDPMDLD